LQMYQPEGFFRSGARLHYCGTRITSQENPGKANSPSSGFVRIRKKDTSSGLRLHLLTDSCIINLFSSVPQIRTTLNSTPIIAATAAHVHARLAGEGSGHDWFHIERVRKNALHIGKEEGADLFVVELAALLHDIADWKFTGGDDSAGPREARTWLDSLHVDEETIAHVCDIIKGLSFKGAGVKSAMRTKEGMVVQVPTTRDTQPISFSHSSSIF
jgi:hypothetical protein